ncbi:MAG: caspase family protein [Archangium sp.]
MRLTTRILALLFLVLSTSAFAERRYAILVGANEGWATDRPLRYAHDDARRMQDVLVQLGGFAEKDTTLLLDPTTKDLTSALDRLDGMISATNETTLVYFYYSGHSDATALHLRGPALNLTTLAERLQSAKATLSLAVLDSCRSGAILGTKGATPVAAVKLQVDEPVSGFALLSSSGADELAQESRALAGSLFTHHWISALRGAGDTDGDGVVRLTEAYTYAYERTRSDTESTALPQRPGFRFSLKGQGDVPLTRLVAAASTLELEVEQSRRYVVVDGNDQRLVAEARSHPTERRRLQLAAGTYHVKRPTTDGIDVAEVTLAPGAVLWASRLDYQKVPLERGLVKGSVLPDWAASGKLANGDVDEALGMFDRILAEDPHEARARRGKARALLIRSLELQKEGKREEEMKALDEAMSLDPSFGEDPSVARFAERKKVLRAEIERNEALKKAVADEFAHDPRLLKRWGLGFLLVSTKGIIVLEGTWLPKSWLSLTFAGDVVGPGIDFTVKIIPLVSAWSPTVSVGAHYGFALWDRGHSSLSVNGQPVALGYDDIWGKMFHAELGVQWMSQSGFAGEFGAGPMVFWNQATQRFEWFGFVTIGMGWYFH